MEKYLYSDLACEMIKNDGEEVCDMPKKQGHEIYVSRHSGETFDGGRYVTVYTPDLWQLENRKYLEVKKILTEELSNLVKDAGIINITADTSFMVVGLGNPGLTPDALGANVVRHIFVTSHLSYKTRSRLKKPCISAIIPNVTGNTGIETSKIIASVAESFKPDLLIAIDSLASRSLDRLARTIQLNDTGISPGGGIGQSRKKIDESLVNAPTVSIGVPTVIRLSSALADVLLNANGGPLDDNERNRLDVAEGYFVSPKEIDTVIRLSSMLIADSINDCLRIL